MRAFNRQPETKVVLCSSLLCQDFVGVCYGGTPFVLHQSDGSNHDHLLKCHL